jgi:peptidoglycan/LPS O-acetylase OafA/YrhL
MDEGNVSDQIAQLEARIEFLNESIERCRKIGIGAKIAIAAGALWFALMLVHLLPFDVTPFFAAVTAILGGVVLLGSNATTWAQTEADLHSAETMRANMIGGIALRLVGEEPRTIH